MKPRLWIIALIATATLWPAAGRLTPRPNRRGR